MPFIKTRINYCFATDDNTSIRQSTQPAVHQLSLQCKSNLLPVAIQTTIPMYITVCTYSNCFQICFRSTFKQRIVIYMHLCTRGHHTMVAETKTTSHSFITHLYIC